MKKISARDIQLLVAGAFALMGFRALIWLPYYFVTSADLVRIINTTVTGLALPLGIGILLGRVSAIPVARIYLWLVVISGCIVIPTFWYFAPEKGGRIALRFAPELLVAIVLLGLIFWSRSRRFNHDA